jgi:hypothetical protein
MKMATPIRHRAIRRAGELLKQIERQQGARPDIEPTDAADSKLTRTEAARQAGMSKHQQVQAIRVANVPDEDFNRQADLQIDVPSAPFLFSLLRFGLGRVTSWRDADAYPVLLLPNDDLELLGYLGHADQVGLFDESFGGHSTPANPVPFEAAHVAFHVASICRV